MRRGCRKRDLQAGLAAKGVQCAGKRLGRNVERPGVTDT
ncbi:hypothetical protein SF83666_c13460 [Sinorhizobium fredii CCBAU 83666]|nr:hypothetical protein SF83666_c13460 [Sinorhizobium fredii CCBAU 83666]